jgi:hypothetical protein
MRSCSLEVCYDLQNLQNLQNNYPYYCLTSILLSSVMFLISE